MNNSPVFFSCKLALCNNLLTQAWRIATIELVCATTTTGMAKIQSIGANEPNPAKIALLMFTNSSISSSTDSSTPPSKIAWRYYHNNREKHLIKEKAHVGSKYTIISSWELEFAFVFNISISQLEDIRISVEKPNGYLEHLETNQKLQELFAKAIEEIFDS